MWPLLALSLGGYLVFEKLKAAKLAELEALLAAQKTQQTQQAPPVSASVPSSTLDTSREILRGVMPGDADEHEAEPAPVNTDTDVIDPPTV